MKVPEYILNLLELRNLGAFIFEHSDDQISNFLRKNKIDVDPYAYGSMDALYYTEKCNKKIIEAIENKKEIDNK